MLRCPKPWRFMLHSRYIVGKLSMMSRGALTWFETVWSYSVEAIVIIEPFFSMKTINRIVTENCIGIWGRSWCFLERPLWLWVRFNKIEFTFTIFRAKVWKTLILEWILLVEIQTIWKIWVWHGTIWCVHIAEFRNFQFWKCEKLKNVFTLGPTAQATLVCIKFRSNLKISHGF